MLADVINRVNTGSQEFFRRWQAMDGRSVEKPNGIFDKLDESIVSINVFAPVKWFLFHCAKKLKKSSRNKRCFTLIPSKSSSSAGETPGV
jgi:hypothetical protein